ncbi:conserved hypothetical protein [Leishmania infantum JPCM5]|uniref:NPHP4 Ig-like domain-containing protein n=2 Tax=Leishmania infantum TaxID=5671 RepID=A4I1P8_LEIIN|nr:conserved hypothetical protein [Leishmania infantum JPCM5]CAC9494976.1 hypothetical_protein_-_conserved [Leishmania infantum]CAM68678.1 conserved hypothetical protein [Leishmania infantum JPCM5]SUZ42538.1 hypothetical_protein_-_conserved [Leishmania infantum]|eukprot:XP_001466239.1 conserved hypothetical protein [Leishmania infantum JPCM5]
MPRSGSPAWHSRSAEQTARLLLSNAFRYDTWECAAARKQVQFHGGAVHTLRLRFRELTKQRIAASDIEAVNLALFDPARKMFLGATYQLEARDMTRPLAVQVAPAQLLVLETVVHDTRPSAPLEEYRVTSWGFCPVEEMMSGTISVRLRPGSAHLLLVEKSSWPAVSLPTAPSDVALTCDVAVDQDAALAQLMGELVPPGIFVSEDFTRATPMPGTSLFRLCVRSIELSGSTEESAWNLADPDADWSVAAVAHNGFQQLGKGSEVSLVLEAPSDGGRHSSSSTTSSSSTRRPPAAPAANTVLLRSDLPLEIDRLPVHSATSLVLAIRRRAPGSRAFAVLGFCVLPLCMMPMQDRDIRVENLPALRGPFSCEDARLLMVDSTSPYGRLPIAVTLTVEYHDTGRPARALPAGPVAAPAAVAAQQKEEITKDEVSSSSLTSSASSVISGARPAQVLSTADVPGSRVAVGPPSYTALPTPADGGDSAGIFKLLCTIMEELRKVREAQDMILQQTSGDGSGLAALSPALQERLNKGLADGGVDLIDLAPRPLAVSWRARKLMQDGVQPILHPLHGTLLDDTAPVVDGLTSSLYGFRLEGITMDNALHMPVDICLLFSFGPLPYQQVGPLHVTSVERTPTNESYKVYDDRREAGFVWCEPTAALQSSAMRKYKSLSNAVVYVHLYDALSMFYLVTASLPLSTFRRPISATCAMIPMDVVLQRDLSMTEQVVPPKVFPVMRHAGQLHLTIFCVGIGAAAGDRKSCAAALATVHPPENVQSRVITAKKLRHADRLSPAGSITLPSGINDAAAADGGASASPTAAAPPTSESKRGRDGGAGGVGTLHWQRAQYFKTQLREHQQSVGTAPQLPGVPDAHVQAAQEAAELEYRLRQLELERAAVKSRRIAEALLSRLTVEHEVLVISWRPEVVRTSFANPFYCAMEYFVEVDPRDTDVCTVIGAANFVLGPREKTELSLAIRLSMTQATGGGGGSGANHHQQQQNITVRVYSETRELVCCIRVRATVVPPVVDRRYEIFGAPGTEVSKRILSRTFSSASFPVTTGSAALLQRMRELCAFVATSGEKTSVSTNVVLDPITQAYITAWEEATVTTEIPKEVGRQRIEYVTLFYDAAMSRLYETWELCIFACESFMTRDIYWGQTTALGLPAEGTRDMYCSDTAVTVERRGASYVLRLHPRDVGTQRMLLHTLKDDTLKKTLVTVPTVHPTPTYSQVIELSLAEVKGPVLRRLTFVNRGDREEVFQVHHNYKFNLRVNPSKFTLAPSDTQFIRLQFDLLTLPPGQQEGRWPVWIFINNSEDKTVESYHLQIVLRAHPIVSVEP